MAAEPRTGRRREATPERLAAVLGPLLVAAWREHQARLAAAPPEPTDRTDEGQTSVTVDAWPSRSDKETNGAQLTDRPADIVHHA